MINHIYTVQQLAELVRQGSKIYEMNNTISTHLLGSIVQLLKYGEKYSIKIPQKEHLEQILLNTKFLLDEHSEIVQEFNNTLNYFNADQPKGNSSKTTDKETEPVLKNDRKKIICYNNF